MTIIIDPGLIMIYMGLALLVAGAVVMWWMDL